VLVGLEADSDANDSEGRATPSCTALPTFPPPAPITLTPCVVHPVTNAPSVGDESRNVDPAVSDAKFLEELYKQDAKQFPFPLVRSSVGSELAAWLRKIECENKFEPYTQFVTALNCVLVWTRARTASLPTWDSTVTSENKQKTEDFVALLSNWSLDLKIVEVIIVQRRQMYRSGAVTEQRLIARRECPRVRFEAEPPVRDDELGRELDMYPRNAEQFAAGRLEGETRTFSIWEAGSDVLLYAEMWSEALLSPLEVREFVGDCVKRVALWNSSMESLGLPYRFYGTMDSKRSEVPWDKAVNTKRICGKPFIGIDRRGSDDQFDVEGRTAVDVCRQRDMARSDGPTLLLHSIRCWGGMIRLWMDRTKLLYEKALVGAHFGKIRLSSMRA
jgi:hypothetical protein